MYALLDRVKAERQDHEVMDSSEAEGSTGTSVHSNMPEQKDHQHVSSDQKSFDEGDLATLQLHAVDDNTSQEHKNPSVRKLKLPGASQRTSTLKLRKRQ